MEKKTCTYLSVSLTVQLIVCLSAGLSVFLSVHLIGYLSFCQSVCVFSEFWINYLQTFNRTEQDPGNIKGHISLSKYYCCLGTQVWL